MNMWLEYVFVFYFTSALGVKLENFDMYNLVRSCKRGEFQENSFCYNVTMPRDLPSADNLPFTEHNIFFLETACKGGLDYREACAVEAAARAHPRKRINVLFTGPVPRICAETGPLGALQNITNIKLYRIHLSNFSVGTPIHEWFTNGYWARIMKVSPFPVRHTADMLRFLTLYRFGGIYLDLDVLVTWSFDNLPRKMNWVGRQDRRDIGSALIAISNDEVGRMVIDEIMSVLMETFTPRTWSYNSIGVITMALQRICGTIDLNRMSYRACRGFTIYPQDFFYPISSGDWQFFFKPLTTDVEGTFAFHLWNKESHKADIWEDSLYAQIAAHACPKSFHFFKIRKV